MVVILFIKLWLLLTIIYLEGLDGMGVMQASPFSPLMFIEQEPHIPSRQDLKS